MTMTSRLLRPRAVPVGIDWRRHVRAILLLAVPALVLLAALMFWLMGGRYASTENAYVKADIAQIASEVPGRIAELSIRDHAVVAEGQVLVQLDPAPYKLALAKAEAELDSARATLEQLKVSLRESKAEHKEAESRMLYLEVQARRQHELAARGVSPATKIELADSDALQARERVARVQASLGGNPELPTDSYPLVREKIASRDRAALDLAYTGIKAPRAGTVVNFKLQPGEQIKAQTPLFSIVSERRPWVEANFKETDLTNVVVGQKATVVLDIYPDITWDAEVESISRATGAEFAILPPQNASGNWVKVVQRLPVRLRLIERPGEPPLRAGMTAWVSIDTQRSRSVFNLFGGGSAVAAKRP